MRSTTRLKGKAKIFIKDLCRDMHGRLGVLVLCALDALLGPVHDPLKKLLHGVRPPPYPRTISATLGKVEVDGVWRAVYALCDTCVQFIVWVT